MRERDRERARVSLTISLFFLQEPESSPDKKSWDKNNASNNNNKFSNGAESPKSVRKRFGSASEDTLLKVNGVNDGVSLTAQEMEAFKAEIIKEMRKEFQKMKQEIIDGTHACCCGFSQLLLAFYFFFFFCTRHSAQTKQILWVRCNMCIFFRLFPAVRTELNKR